MFAESAAPVMDSGVNATSADDSPTRRNAHVHCTVMPHKGFPSEVIQADEVCTSEEVTAFTLISLTRFISSSFSPALSDGKIILTVSGANIYSAIANGTDIAAVYKSDFLILRIAPALSPFAARGEICGTLAAASP